MRFFFQRRQKKTSWTRLPGVPHYIVYKNYKYMENELFF